MSCLVIEINWALLSAAEIDSAWHTWAGQRYDDDNEQWSSIMMWVSLPLWLQKGANRRIFNSPPESLFNQGAQSVLYKINPPYFHSFFIVIKEWETVDNFAHVHLYREPERQRGVRGWIFYLDFIYSTASVALWWWPGSRRVRFGAYVDFRRSLSAGRAIAAQLNV